MKLVEKVYWKKKNEIKNIIFEYELRKKIFQQIVN